MKRRKKLTWVFKGILLHKEKEKTHIGLKSNLCHKEKETESKAKLIKSYHQPTVYITGNMQHRKNMVDQEQGSL